MTLVVHWKESHIYLSLSFFIGAQPAPLWPDYLNNLYASTEQEFTSQAFCTFLPRVLLKLYIMVLTHLYSQSPELLLPTAPVLNFSVWQMPYSLLIPNAHSILQSGQIVYDFSLFLQCYMFCNILSFVLVYLSSLDFSNVHPLFCLFHLLL
jgi:hypothetical protein